MACLLVLTDHDELSMVLTKISIQPVLDRVSVENEAITDNYSQTWLIGFAILGAVNDNIHGLKIAIHEYVTSFELRVILYNGVWL